jgi:hypothetical protein
MNFTSTTDTTMKFDAGFFKTLDSLTDGGEVWESYNNIDNSFKLKKKFTKEEKLNLTLETSEWRVNVDRFLYVQFERGQWLTEDRQQSVVELLVRIGRPRSGNTAYSQSDYVVEGRARKLSDNLLTEGYIGMVFENGRVQYYVIDNERIEKLEEVLGHALSNLESWKAHEPRVEVYVAPSDKTPGKKNKFWSSTYVKIKKKKHVRHCIKKSAAYQHYRDNIDDILLQTVLEYRPNSVTDGGDDDDGGEDGEDGEISGKFGISGNSKMSKMRIAELCSGDGSFAFKLLTKESKNIESYVLFERNKQLSNVSRQRLSSWLPSDALTEKSLECKNKEISNVDNVQIAHINIDVYSQEGEERLNRLETGPNVWIASGSVLNGQVGNHTMAKSMLKGMASSLCSNNKNSASAVIVITGYTQTYLTPQMIRECGLKIKKASVPSHEASGLCSGFGRFHMFVLEKDEREYPENHDGILRSIMLGNT